MGDLKKRLAMYSFVVLVASALIYYSQLPAVSVLLVIAIGLLAAVGVWEYAGLAKAKDLNPATMLMAISAFFEVIAFALALKYDHLRLLPVIVLAGATVFFFLRRFANVSRALAHIALEFFGVCYLALPFCFMLGVLYPGPLQDGRWWLLYLIGVTKISDTAAYFIGRLFGKHKLAPVLSPKKTVEGAIAGFIASIGLSVGFSFLGKMYSEGTFALSVPNAVWLGALIAVMAQIGDLAESLLKRDAVVKDSSTLPGIGGILDMVDSLLLTTPVVYFFIAVQK